ncbi:MAG: ABC transporter ATP-binding protein [Candidatus Izemoplasmatales bacterium]|nr:ABC transporter ATP-binding protein [Candidatus Izemoplasmatales bacterium]
MGKLLKYLKPYWFKVSIIFVLVSLVSVGTLLLPDYMSDIIAEGISAEYREYNPVTDSFEIADSCDVEANPLTCEVNQRSDFMVILKYGSYMLGVTLVSSLAFIALMYLSSDVGSQFGRDIRKDYYRKITTVSVYETDKFGTSTLITRASNDVMQVQNFMTMALRLLLRIPIVFIGASIFAFQKSLTLTIPIFIGVPALIILIVIVFILVVPLFKLVQKKIDQLTLVTRESINGVRVIRAFGQGDREVERFEETNVDLTMVNYKAGKIMSYLNPIINLLFNAVILGVTYTAYRMVLAGTLVDYRGLGDVSAIIQYATLILFSILMLTFTFVMFPRAQVSAKRIVEVLELESSIIDTGSKEYDDYNFKGKVEFKDVCFKFPDAEINVLDNINFIANPGETIALIGSTGSGKSTVVNLMPRFFDISCGELLIDGVPIKDIKLNTLRNLIGFVPQTATLFSGTIKSNIGYGKKNATEDEIKEAAEIAQASGFIEEMEEGYDSLVEQGGVNFSGGQKQRLSIARALIRKPKIYIFDDGFSALDFRTDAALRSALKENVKESTVFIVAQRIGTIMNADKIIVLHEGKIVGIGKHDELLKTSDVYREIALSQLGEEEIS